MDEIPHTYKVNNGKLYKCSLNTLGAFLNKKNK